VTETNGKFSQTPMNSAVARPKVEFTSAAEQHRTISPPPIEYGPSLEPPFYGTSSVLRWEWAEILPSIDTKKLFKSFLGGGELDAAAFEQAEKTEYMPAFQRLREEIEKDALIDSAAIYGYFPVITEDEKIILLDPGDFHTELAEFVFPRMQQNGGSSIADYLRPSGDLLAVQAVTAGQGIGRRATEFLNKEGPRMLGTFLNGIGVYLAGNLADRVTVELRRGLGLPDGAGRRFSFGQPGMPLLAEQQRLMEILAVEERLGIQLAEDFSLVPAHSALEIFIHHPNA
jgi:5-methyltetrahydrofolate--homocysteine methyltransferase